MSAGFADVDWARPWLAPIEARGRRWQAAALDGYAQYLAALNDDAVAAAHVTGRALQYAFRRHLDTTPLAHLRQIRLSHAHQDLMNADPNHGATVTEIAARWGFHHAGRFATLYREAYGSSPPRTLREG